MKNVAKGYPVIALVSPNPKSTPSGFVIVPSERILFTLYVILKSVLHSNSGVLIFTVRILNSKPLLLISPTLLMTELNPEEDGTRSFKSMP